MKDYPISIRLAVYMLLTIMTIFILYAAAPILIPVSIGVLLTFLLMPISRWFEKYRVPRPLAILLSILVMIILLGGLITFLSSQFLSFAEDLPLLNRKLTEKFAVLQSYVAERFNVSEQYQISWIKKQLSGILSSSGEIITNIFSATGTFIAAAALIPIYIFFLTLYRHKFIDFMKSIAHPDRHDWLMDVVHRTSLVSQKYLIGLLIDIFILAVLNSIGFLILGIKHAILLGIVAGLLNIIPYIGVLIGSIFPVLIALITKDSIWVAAGAAGVCVFVQFLDNNFITPKVVGSAVSINPLATMIALLSGAMIWGLAGMMLFIPYLGMMKVVLDNVDQLKPFGYLIGEEKNLKRKKLLYTKKKSK
jgi:AI-2 transport protein TqsA